MIFLIIFGVLCGFIASILGAGSSMILTPLLLYVYPLITGNHFTIQTITSATLGLTFFSTAAATIRYHNARLIPYRYAIILAASGSIGSFISGSFIAENINRLFILIIFGIIVVLSLIFNFIPIEEKEEEPPTRKFFVLGSIIIFLLGIITGIIGIGGMVIFMPYMIYVLRFSVRKTIGTTTFCGALIALFGIVGKSVINMMNWKIALVVAIGGIIGGFIGPTLGKHIPNRFLRYGLNVILVLIIIMVLIDIFKNNI
ncbi:sulfite exporter TauE/SafE family protein [Bacillus sp. JJ1532]|uniref:sulfite exporter TauE/SafE family protein n=1 Tax=Bacillus sp. JJ1532 TaxID=3122958 RepID=UPI002FFE1B57